jgi:hypothetical protein
MVLRAQQLAATELGCLLAALLSERDLFRSSSSSSGSADLGSRLRVLVGMEELPAGMTFDAAGGSRVLLSAHQIVKQLTPPAAAEAAEAASPGNGGDSASTLDELDEAESSEDDDADSSSSSRVQQHSADAAGFAAACRAQLAKQGLLGALVAAAYTDRIAQLRPGSGRPAYTLASGRVVALPSASDPLAGQRYVAVAELQAGRDGRNDAITLGAGLPSSAIDTFLADEVAQRTVGLIVVCRLRLALVMTPGLSSPPPACRWCSGRLRPRLLQPSASGCWGRWC